MKTSLEGAGIETKLHSVKSQLSDLVIPWSIRELTEQCSAVQSTASTVKIAKGANLEIIIEQKFRIQSLTKKGKSLLASKIFGGMWA